MNCERALPLVEKLADGECSPEERAWAEAHLESCESCGSHLKFLSAVVEAARRSTLPEPPEAYWQYLPQKVSARIREEESLRRRRGWFGAGWFPSLTLRLAGALAFLALVAVVGVRVIEMHERPLPKESEASRPVARQPDSVREQPARPMDRVPAAGPSASEGGAAAPPPVSRPESAGALAGDEELNPAESRRERKAVSGEEASARPVTRDREIAGAAGAETPSESPESLTGRKKAGRDSSQAPRSASRSDRVDLRSEPSSGGAAPSPPAATPSDRPADRQKERWVAQDFAKNVEEPTARESFELLRKKYGASPPRSTPESVEASTRALGASGLDPAEPRERASECAAWREFLSRYPASEEAAEARYRLASCSLRLFELDPTEAHRRQAIEEAESFLTTAPQGEAVEEIRRRLEEVRRR